MIFIWGFIIDFDVFMVWFLVLGNISEILEVIEIGVGD